MKIFRDKLIVGEHRYDIDTIKAIYSRGQDMRVMDSYNSKTITNSELKTYIDFIDGKENR